MSALVNELLQAADDERDHALEQDYWHEELLRKAAAALTTLQEKEASWEETRKAVATLNNENGQLRYRLEAMTAERDGLLSKLCGS